MSKREELLEQARSLLGAGAGSWVHTALVDDYNSIRPLPQGYRLQYSDAWCAAFVSVCAKRAGLLELIPAECSCPRMIEGFRALGRWVEDDGYVPAAGDIIFYDWEDSGSGDNTGTADHVGIIESVDEANGSFTTIEGNINSTVARRFLPLNGQGTYLQCMTIFSITPDKKYSSITLSITMSRSGPKARYSTNSPGSPGGSSGTDKQFSVGSNTITLTGTFNAGTTYTLYVWGINYSSYDYGTVSGASATGVVFDDDGVARVRSSGAWNQYIPEVRGNGAWGQYEPYVYYSGQWRKIG